jgi:uncharacterized membrane protein
MTAEAAAAGVPPVVPPESPTAPPPATARAEDVRTVPNESAPPETVASRAASTASREAAQAAHAAATNPRASQPELLRNPLVWAGIVVLVLALLFLIL